MKSTRVTTIEKIFLSNKEAQEYLGVGADFMQDLRSRAEISFFKKGKMIWYRKKDIDRLVESSKVI